MSQLSHTEKMQLCLSGEILSRVPIAFWRHFPVDDQNPYTLAKSTINFQNTFDFDFIKVSPSSSFCLKDWGIRDKWNGNPEGTREYINKIIDLPSDWLKLKPLNPTKGFLGQQLTCLKLLKKEYGDKTPIIQTIFNPLSQAKNLIGKENLCNHLRLFPEQLKIALDRIVNITLDFISECKKIGVDGIFYAVQHASAELLSYAEFIEFEKSYDLKVLEITRDLWLNVIHIHGNNIYFKGITDYPATIFNWHDRETSPSLSEGQKMFDGVVCGGLSRINSMVLGNSNRIKKEINDARNQTGCRKFVLGTGCVLPVIVPYGNIIAARNIIDKK